MIQIKENNRFGLQSQNLSCQKYQKNTEWGFGITIIM